MIDSWMPRKLEPGFDATYSKSRDFNTSTMKSPPGRSVVMASTSAGGSVSRAAAGAGVRASAAAGAGPCAAEVTAPGSSAAAPVAAVPFRKPRRSTERILDISSPLRPEPAGDWPRVYYGQRAAAGA